MRTLKILLMAIGLLGMAGTIVILIWFSVRSNHYFPDRYEEAFATGFYLLCGWACYGIITAIFLWFPTFLEWLSSSKKR